MGEGTYMPAKGEYKSKRELSSIFPEHSGPPSGITFSPLKTPLRESAAYVPTSHPHRQQKKLDRQIKLLQSNSKQHPGMDINIQSPTYFLFKKEIFF